MNSHMAKMRDNAIVGNIGHFDNEIDMAGLEAVKGIKVENIKAQVDRYVFPDGKGIIVLASGRLLNWPAARWLPAARMQEGAFLIFINWTGYKKVLGCWNNTHYKVLYFPKATQGYRHGRSTFAPGLASSPISW